MALAAARAFIGGGDQAAQFAQTIQRAIQLFNCSDGLQATLAGMHFVHSLHSLLCMVLAAAVGCTLCSDARLAGGFVGLMHACSLFISPLFAQYGMSLLLTDPWLRSIPCCSITFHEQPCMHSSLARCTTSSMIPEQ